ncbi:hypothetical protein GCM10011414_06010 [Croceivirga lutea]|uniref:hypothetical protein n=1 Tax=Croceivirga lutea TaxID=1775167 RepID=UPI00163A87D6|nr:hypothetical protein [Croceivirga lutea]GGG39444.1 hypothetical protein GCM10011414_06010 [Croceivirga lutea]
MKRVKDIPYFKNIREIREYSFGKFYFFDGLVISEINQGITFNWKMAERAIKAAKEIFGDEMPVAYISNRVNEYYVVPTDWSKFFANRHRLLLYSVVGETKGSFASLMLEKIFFGSSINKFHDIEDAISWNLKQLKSKRAKDFINQNGLSPHMK